MFGREVSSLKHTCAAARMKGGSKSKHTSKISRSPGDSCRGQCSHMSLYFISTAGNAGENTIRFASHRYEVLGYPACPVECCSIRAGLCTMTSLCR